MDVKEMRFLDLTMTIVDYEKLCIYKVILRTTKKALQRVIAMNNTGKLKCKF